jgi:hypothetical protein
MLFRAQIQLQVPAPAPALPSHLETNVEAIAQASGQAKAAGSPAAQPKTAPPPAAGRHPSPAAARQNRGGKGVSSTRHNGSHDARATRPNHAQPRPAVPKARPPQRAAALASASNNKNGAMAKPGRNDPCYCGSGRKYKVCHGR